MLILYYALYNRISHKEIEKVPSPTHPKSLLLASTKTFLFHFELNVSNCSSIKSLEQDSFWIMVLEPSAKNVAKLPQFCI